MSSTTSLVHEGSRSDKIRIGRGVRQGDPLSPFLFNLAAKNILDRLSSNVGYDLRGVLVDSLAFGRRCRCGIDARGPQERISRMSFSGYDAARAASETQDVVRRISWATAALRKFGGVEGPGEYWARRLHDSVDGRDLGMCARASPSYSWMGYSGLLSNGTFKDLCRLRSGSRPSAVRTSRSRRRGGCPEVSGWMPCDGDDRPYYSGLWEDA